MSDDPQELLDLADWRRRVADLYTAVRAEAPRDASAAWEHWRETRERLFREHSQSPVPAGERAAFRARHWPYDPAFRFEAIVEAEPPEPAVAAFVPAEPVFGRLTLSLPISTGGE